MKPTDEQLEIINSLKQCDNIKVYAYAGTGKTTTLKMLTNHYSRYKFLYLAFNSSIAKEAKNKFPFNTEVRTTHSLARYMVRNDIDTSNLINKYRVVDILDLYDDIENYMIGKLILDSFTGYCHSSFKEINEDNIYEIIKSDKNRLSQYHILRKYNLNLLKNITEKVKDLWDKMLDGYVKMTHDFYLKYFQLNLDKYTYKCKKWDCVLLDEAQDTNDVTLDIFINLPVKKKIMVGDIYQKIYGFRGSINAMEKFNADKELYLSTTFRFHEEIAKQANQILSNIRKETVLIKTQNELDDFIQNVAILSRTNSGLIEVADKLIKEGKAFNTIRPVDEITRLPLSVLGYMYGVRDIKDKWLYRFDDIEEMRDFATELNDVELLSAISIAENYKTELYDIVEIMRSMEKLKTNIFLSTAHSAKGLEWDRVIILDNYPDIIDKFIENKIFSLQQFHKLLSKNNKDALEIAEEINLMYVAITRAKKELINNSRNQNYFSLEEAEFDKELLLRKNQLLESEE